MKTRKSSVVAAIVTAVWMAAIACAGVIDLKQPAGGNAPLGGTGSAAHVSMGGTSYAYINTATTTQVKTGAGFLHCITVNATSIGTISIIDNTAGTTVNVGLLKASVAEGSYCYDVAFAAGLRIITAGASDITVSYR